MNITKTLSFLISLSCLSWTHQTQATPISIVNAGFEDTSGQFVFNEFTFGLPTGWDLFDPNNITGNGGVFLGTLLPNGTDFFNTTAPEGNRVSILFNEDQFGLGEYGYTQILNDTLQANTRYDLSVEVGNIASGTTQNNSFFNLNGFPGYRVELLAGNQVIAVDDNSLLDDIPEAEFRTSNLSFTTGLNNALLGQVLGIRLVNLNQIPIGFDANNSPDLEVDFDDIRLSAVNVVSAPSTLILLAIAPLGFVCRKKMKHS